MCIVYYIARCDAFLTTRDY